MKQIIALMSISLFITFSIFSMYEQENISSIGYFGKILTMAVTIIVTAFIFLNELLKMKVNKKTFLLLLFLFFLFIGSIHGLFSDRIDSYEYFFYTAYFILTIIYLYTFVILYFTKMNLEKEINKFILILHVVLLVNMLIGLVLIFLLNITIYDYALGGFEGSMGLSAFLQNRGQFGLLCLLSFFTVFYLYKQSRKWNYLAFILLYILLMLLTNSRTVVMIMLTFFVFQTYYNLKNKIKNIYIKAIFFMILLTSMIFSSIMIDIYSAQIDYETVSSGRTMIWGLALLESTQDISTFLFGNGIFSLSTYIAEKYAHLSYHFSVVEVLSLHSSYLEILAAGGMISLIIFLILMLKSINVNSYMNSVLLSILVGSFFEGIIVMPTIPLIAYFWVFVIISSRFPYQMKTFNS